MNRAYIKAIDDIETAAAAGSSLTLHADKDILDEAFLEPSKELTCTNP